MRASVHSLFAAIESIGPVLEARLESSVAAALDRGLASVQKSVVARAEHEAADVANQVAEKVRIAVDDSTRTAIDDSFRQIETRVTDSFTALQKPLQDLGSLTQPFESAGRVIEQAAIAASSASRSIGEELEGVRSRTAEICRHTEQQLEGLVRGVRESKSETSGLFSELQTIVDNSAGLFSDSVAGAIQEGLDAIASGAITYQEFLKTYGDYEIILKNKAGKIRELIAQTNTDTSQFAKNFRDLFDFVREDSVSFDEGLAALEERLQGRFEGIAKLFKEFEERGLTIEQLRKQLEDFTDALGDGPLEDVINELLQKLQEENRR